jgi:hypothetical protein
LSAFGEEEDSASLLPLLKHKEEYVRSNAARALAKIGGESAAAEIGKTLNERRATLTPEQQRIDASLGEMKQAAETIKDRLDGKNGSGSGARPPDRPSAQAGSRSLIVWILASVVLSTLIIAMIVISRRRSRRGTNLDTR